MKCNFTSLLLLVSCWAHAVFLINTSTTSARAKRMFAPHAGVLT